MATATTINIRINSTLKERGDAVLKQNGISTTEAIRMLWEEMSQTRQLPDFIARKQENSANSIREKKFKALDCLCAIAQPTDFSPTDKHLFDEYYGNMLKEYLELS